VIKSVLELGCGTGNLAKRIHDAGYDYIGIDLFDEMLTIAKSTAPKARFHQADARNFKLDEKQDCVIITGRSISYLTSNIDLIDTFTCISNNLKIGGLLMFDAIDASKLFVNFIDEKLETILVTFGSNEYKRISKSRKNLQSGWTWDWESAYFLKNQAGDYERIGEDLSTLRAFLQDELSLLFKITGFHLVNILPKKSYTWDNNFFIAKKI
jgi:SAM-dependent methyltransferase